MKDPGCQTIHSDPAGNALNPAEIHNHVRKVVVRVSVQQIFKIPDIHKKWILKIWLLFCLLF